MLRKIANLSAAWLILTMGLLSEASAVELSTFFNVVTGVNSNNSSYTLVGPCDILATAGTPCVAAHSVTRRLLGSYAGSLFQLTRASDSTTQNIGSTASGLYNAAAVSAFCSGTYCYFSDIYDQTGNANHLPQATLASMAPWMLYPGNGLPIVWTTGNAAFYRNRTGTTNIPTGTAASTALYVRASDMYSSCCGDYGRMENSTGSIVAGEMYALAYTNFSGNGFLGFGVDLEGTVPSTPIATSPTVGLFLSKFVTATGLYTNELWNAATGAFIPQMTKAPAVTPIVQSGMSLGEGGDGNASASMFFEGVVTSGTTTSVADAAVSANVAAFYGSQAGFYLGPYDLSTNAGCAGVNCAAPNTGPGATTESNISAMIAGAWGLRKLRASYTGYAANIRRASDSTTTNIGFTSTGDFDDQTAQSFCSTTTCSVARLYNQSITRNGTSDGNGNDGNGTVYDMVQVTVANQPSLNFNALGGKTVLHSAGSGYMCMPAATNIGNMGNPTGWTAGAVARRSGNTGALTYALSANGTSRGIQYPASTNTAGLTPGGGGSVTSTTASDNAFHFLAGYVDASGTPTFQVDNATAVTTAGPHFSGVVNYLCIMSASFTSNSGVSWTVQDVITGDYAEGFMAVPPLTSAQLTAIYNNQHVYYGGAF